MAEGHEAGFLNPGQVVIRIDDSPDGHPCVLVQFAEMGWVALPYPDQVDEIADALHEYAEELRAEIRRRSAGLN